MPCRRVDAALGDKKPAIAIHDVPLEWCFQPAVKLDFRHFADGHVVTAAEVKAELQRVGHTLQPLEIVVVNTRAGSRYGQADYVSAGCGMGYEATMFRLEQGVRLTGTDAWSWDAPFVHTAKKYDASRDASLIWEGHKAGRDIGYCHLEKLHNLEALPADGFTISCFPHKIRGASAGWNARGGDLRRHVVVIFAGNRLKRRRTRPVPRGTRTPYPRSRFALTASRASPRADVARVVAQAAQETIDLQQVAAVLALAARLVQPLERGRLVAARGIQARDPVGVGIGRGLQLGERRIGRIALAAQRVRERQRPQPVALVALAARSSPARRRCDSAARG